MMSEEMTVQNSSQISSNNEKYLNVISNLSLYNYQRISSAFDEIILINNHFQIITSLLLCIVGLLGTILHLGIFIRRCFHTKAFSHQIFIQLLFDFCHLINIVLTHLIIIIVYIKTSTYLDLHCPISTFFVSLGSFGSISFLCLGAFKRYRRKQSQSRCIQHRLLAHRIILITSISWLIIHFPKFNFNEHITT